MPQLPPIGIEFTASATAALKTLRQITKTMTAVGEAAKIATEALDAASASVTAVTEPLTAVAKASTAAKTGMQGFARASRSVAQAADKAAVSTDAAMVTIGDSAGRMADAVTASSEAAVAAVTSLNEKSAGLGTAFMAGADEAVAALARLTEASGAAAAAMEDVALKTKASAAESSAAAEGMGAKFLGLNEIGKQVKSVLPLSLAAVGYESVKMASDFKTATTQLVTSAGESVKNINMVRDGLLNMAGQVGVSATNLAKALYYVNAAGYHAGDGLTVLKAAAQGAAAEGADTTTVAKALTDVLVDYHLKASAATDVTSKMITAVANGKTNLQEFSGAFASIVPAASAAGISFQDVMAALAQMTNHGFTAARASQNLAQALRSMLNPTATMQKAFTEYGVSSEVLKQKLAGPNGLTDAMEYLSQAATKAGPEGTTKFAAALKLLVGTAPGANAALATVGANYKATASTIRQVGSATSDAQGKVKGFALVQQNLGQQLKQLRAGFDSVMIRIGDGLIPVLSKMISLIESKASPAFHSLGSALHGMAAGFTGNIPKGQEGQKAPQMTGWEKVGQVLRGVARDFAAFGHDAAQAMHNVAQAAGPVLTVLGGAFLAALKAVGAVLAHVVGPALKDFTGFLAHNQGLVKAFAEVVLGGLAAKLTLIGGIKAATGITELGTKILGFPVKQIESIKAAFAGLKTAGQGLMEAGRAIKAIAASEQLAAAASKIWAAAQAALDAVMDANPIVLIVIAVVALVAGLIYAYNHVAWFRNMVNTALHAVGQVAQWLWHALQAAWNGIVQGVMWLWHGIEGTWHAIVAVTTSVWNGIVSFFKKWWPLLLVIFMPFIAALIAVWNHFHKQIMDVVHEVWAAISGFLKGIWDGIKAIAGAVWEAIKVTIVNPVLLVWHQLKTVWNTASHWLSSIWDWIWNQARSIWGWIKRDMIQPIEDAWHAITSTVDRIAQAISDGLHHAWNAVKSVGSWFMQIGSAIVKGIIQGVESAGGALYDSLKGLANGALKAAKSFLGINSPSKLFADQVGLGIPEGVAKGVSDHAHLAVTAVNRMAAAAAQVGTSTTQALTGGYASPALGATFGAAGYLPASGQPVINVTVKGSVLSERDLRDVVQTQMLRLGARNSQTWAPYKR